MSYNAYDVLFCFREAVTKMGLSLPNHSDFFSLGYLGHCPLVAALGSWKEPKLWSQICV